MSVKERLKADPGIMVRAMRCESREDIELLLKVEGITGPEDIEEAYSLLELGDKALEAIAGGKMGKVQTVSVGTQTDFGGIGSSISPKLVPVKSTSRPVTAGGTRGGLSAAYANSSSLASGAAGFAAASKQTLLDAQRMQSNNSMWNW